ncbi:hypothetical protein BUALT_Bualt17G0074900 [Buddleja alternifolia]|uniref:Transmembrane protein n=1 Tax=Buddleja alternifolia TaxID=168488 RepID=A0AAV6WFY5_9LAMI|nr:hypothetical protein BUALT_Bualt17G0074900 [Buddleja alternifolia]
MENEHQVSEELNEWEQIQSPFSTINESSVFPPTNHEDLPVTTPQDNNQHLQQSGPVNSISPSNGGDDSNKWIRLHLRAFLSRILRIGRGIRKYVTCKDGFWKFTWSACGVAAVVLLWWQRRMIERSKESLMLLIREKDQKINQLLLQIAEMNEVLLARRRVHVVRVK